MSKLSLSRVHKILKAKEAESFQAEIMKVSSHISIYKFQLHACCLIKKEYKKPSVVKIILILMEHCFVYNKLKIKYN